MIWQTLIAGVAAGILSGIFGVGGGAIFVPALVLIFGVGQLEAEGTSLLAMIPVALLGAVTQSRSGLVSWKPAVVIGLVSGIGVLGGNLVAENVGQDDLRKAFAVFLLLIAGQLARRSWRDRQKRII
jgi:uncharacterized membrane protein YfcA